VKDVDLAKEWERKRLDLDLGLVRARLKEKGEGR
jgi:hypothetical protein